MYISLVPTPYITFGFVDGTKFEIVPISTTWSDFPRGDELVKLIWEIFVAIKSIHPLSFPRGRFVGK